MEDRVDFEPLDNGLDYMLSVVGHLAGDPGPSELKYAVLHLAAAIEVLLKARLAEEHWSLVFRSTDTASRTAYETGDFDSVSTDKAIDRLANVVGLDLAERDKKAVKRVVAKRNRLQHHGLTDSAQAVKAVANEALSFLLSFVGEHLRGEPGAEDPQVESTLGEVRDLLGAIDDFVAVRLRSIASALDNQQVVVECPDCGREALVLGYPCTCYFCLARDDPTTSARRYIDLVLGESEYLAVKEAGMFPLYSCPSCGNETLVAGVRTRPRTGTSEHLTQWCCFSEANAWDSHEVDSCDRCGVPIIRDDEGPSLCETCIDQVFGG